jgi:uncharacterized protein YqhQ
MSEKTKEPYYYGGQAVMEGVMMRGRRLYAMAIRKPNGEIHIEQKVLKPVSDKYAVLKWPVIRGVVAFGSSLSVGIGTLSKSAEIAGEGLLEEESTTRFEKFLEEKLGDKLNKVLVTISVVIAIFVGLGLFMLLPAWVGSLFISFLNASQSFAGIIEGFIRIGIFVAYVYLVSLSKDIRRVFEYHGAEHKTLHCHEQKEELTNENIMKQPRLHKRCGTSFLLIVMVISMIVFLFVRTDNIWMRMVSRIILLPLIAGLSYEVSVKWAGKRDNWLVRAITFPGMCLQRLTTAEPDEKQIEAAVVALKTVLESEPAEINDV